MKKLLIILMFLSSASCGEGNLNNICSNDYRGFCLNMGVYPTKAEYFNAAIDFTELAVQEFHPEFDLSEMTDTYGQYLITVADEHYDVRGRTLNPNIIIRYLSTEDETLLCMEHTYVTTHEILHLVADDFLETSPESNSSHLIPNLFLTWAFSIGEHPNTTAEWFAYWMSKAYCGWEG